MALPPPSPQSGVPRDDVHEVVRTMLKFDDRVRWIAVVFEKSDGGEDLFTVTPWTQDPTLA